MADPTNEAQKQERSWKQRLFSRAVLVGLLLFVAGIIFAGGFNVALHKTNELEFCTSCHSMKTNFNEYKETVHYKNASGVRAVCSDCHVPKPFIPKMIAKVLAYKDVMHELLGTLDTPEKYEAHRWEMANAVWDKMRATNSRECKSCHSFDQMDLSEQGKSGRRKHARAQENNEQCIDCHAGIAHELPDEPEDAADGKSEG